MRSACEARPAHGDQSREVEGEVKYAHKWHVKTTFSDLKKIFGDTLRAKAWEHVTKLMENQPLSQHVQINPVITLILELRNTVSSTII